MTSIINPTGYLQLDILYYLLIVGLGPVMGCYLLIFRPKRLALFDAYRHTGVDCLGIITHRKVTIRRGAVTGIEQGRSHQIRFAYKPPGSDVIFIKDFVLVQREQLQRRLIPVVVLPGRPDTGVPTFLILPKRNRYFGALISAAFTCFSIFVFAALVTYFGLLSGGQSCQTVWADGNGGRVVSCELAPISFLFSIVIVMMLGALGSWLIYLKECDAVPGIVWQTTTPPPVATATPVETPSWRQFERMDDRPEIPVAEAVAVLDSEEAAQQAYAVLSSSSDADAIHAGHEVVARPVYPDNGSNDDAGLQLASVEPIPDNEHELHQRNASSGKEGPLAELV